MTIKALRDQRNAKALEARNLLDPATTKFTKEISAKVDEIYAEIDLLDSQIDRLEKQAKIDGERDRDDTNRETQDRINASLTPDQREHASKYRNAFRSFLIHGERGISQDESLILRTGRPQAAQSGQQGNGAAGGYLVPTGFGAELIEALKSFGGMRDVANVIQTAGGNPFPYPTVDETGQEGEIVAESTPATSQDITFGTIQIGAFKFSSKIFTVPIELLMDQGPGMDVEAYIRKAAATRIARAQNRYFTVGTGTAQPRGIVTAAAAGKVGAAGQTTTVLPDDIIDLIHSVDPAYRGMPNVGFMFHDTTLRALKKIKDNQNRPLWLPGDYSKKEPDTFNAYPYTINQHMPVMAANAKSMIFGDMHEYMIRDILEVTLFRFDDSAFMSKGQIGFLAWARADGNLMTAGAPVAYYQNSAT
ncbi:phage major capsid protein [Sphingomonas abietis]|uniref:Phage major capsid protein n=1 Tax=Sphingomonas abietis TaxID=3012344 RepID=A0ABY7NTF4_9SPHN|nr:phage major capsid protein [Sphingomonas abietis]WBO23938.1 phage major capsid protein [Sphingomonas abietis]